jgi:hypothetical protein
MPSLADVLYWGACWIAAIVALLGLAAVITGSAESWVGVIAFFAVAGAIWVMGRAALFVANARLKTRRKT